jgi:hypothetical protein
VWRWWWLSGAITLAVSALNEGEIMRGRGSDKDGIRFREERGRRGSGWAWQHIGARARGGGGGLLEEREGEGVGVGRAGREAEAQEEGGSWLAEGQCPGSWAENWRWAQAQKEIPFEF